MREQCNFNIIGEFQDTIRYKDGREVVLPKQRNQIVNSLRVLLSSLLKGDSNYGGISYWSIGEGEDIWGIPSLADKFTLQIKSKATSSGNLVLSLDTKTYTIPVVSGDTISIVIDNIKKSVTDLEWVVTSVEDTLTFTSKLKKERKESTFNGTTTGVQSTLTYLVRGSNGNSTPSPSKEDTGCVKEFFRKKILPTDIVYVTQEGEETSSPSNILQVSAVFGYNEAIGNWREFSIFGGNATEVKDSGLAINHKTHGLIEKTSEMEIERRIKFIIDLK